MTAQAMVASRRSAVMITMRIQRWTMGAMMLVFLKDSQYFTYQVGVDLGLGGLGTGMRFPSASSVNGGGGLEGIMHLRIRNTR